MITDYTNIYVFGELRKEIQHVVNVFVRNYGNTVLQQGCYNVRDLERLYRKDTQFINLWDHALDLAYPRDGGVQDIKIEYGSFRCIIPAYMLLAIGKRFEAIVPKRQRGAAICADAAYCQQDT